MAKSNRLFSVRFWGARGSIPTPSPKTTRYGGNTACLEVRCDDELIILDAGSGLRALGHHLALGKAAWKRKATLLFSHLHWDHVQGFPFFAPAYNEGNEITLICERRKQATLQENLKKQMSYPFFPVDMSMMKARLKFREFDNGESFQIGAVKIDTIHLNHPQGCSGFRVHFGGRSFVYATDTEHPQNGCLDENLVKCAQGCQAIIYDTTYTSEEYGGSPKTGGPKIGWGHSTWEEGVKLCNAIGRPKLVLFHHDPSRTDTAVDQMLRKAKAKYPNTIAAKEGLILRL